MENKQTKLPMLIGTMLLYAAVAWLLWVTVGWLPAVMMLITAALIAVWIVRFG